MTSQDFFKALEDLEREKGISKDAFIEALRNAIVFGCKKMYGEANNIELRLNPEKNSIRVFRTKDVVEEVTDPDKQLTLEEAIEIKKGAKIGDVIVLDEISTKDFGRIAAQTAKQVMTQKLRDIERDNTVSEFEDKEGELMACTIRRIEDGNVFVEIGGNQVEGVLLPKEQVPGEKYEVNKTINVFVKRVRNMGKNSQIVVSRTSNGLVKRLFENEVPEIKQGIVQIKAIARDPGQRTKIAIYSADPNVDAVGACVGNKGARVNAIVAELNGEKIDIILWSEDPLEFICKAMAPATVMHVSEVGENSARVVVPDDKLSLAIGRSGQNARLAVRLTGWKIDVKSASAFASENEGQQVQGE